MENKRKLLSRKEIESLPKIELHLHLDCCLSFDAVSDLRPGTTWEAYRNDFVGAARYKDLADFLRIIDNSLALMQTEEGLRRVTEDLFPRLKKDNVIYAEIRFAPLLHLRQGLTPERVVRIVEESVSGSVEKTGIEARLILCTLRHFTEEQSMKTVELVEKFRGTRVTALDLGADEAGFPIAAHIPAFRYARERGIPFTAHAGEAKGPESVWETLEHFQPSRIGHGVRSIEDPVLVEELKNKNIHLEVCPTCNVQIGVFDRYADHPIDRLYHAGVSVGINTDARTITNISLSDEYEKLRQVFGWGAGHFFRCNRGALAAAFLPGPQKRALEEKLGSFPHYSGRV
jgi:adenosine deaminase